VAYFLGLPVDKQLKLVTADTFVECKLYMYYIEIFTGGHRENTQINPFTGVRFLEIFFLEFRPSNAQLFVAILVVQPYTDLTREHRDKLLTAYWNNKLPYLLCFISVLLHSFMTYELIWILISRRHRTGDISNKRKMI